MKKINISWLSPSVIATGVFILFAYWIIALKNGYMMRWVDEMSLFEATPFFFHRCLMYPGGLLRYAGSWLTQLMYYPWLGTIVLISLWMLMAWLTKTAFRLPKAAWTLCLIVPVAMLVSVVQLDEAWLSLKTTGYLYSNTLGYIFTLFCIIIFQATRSHRPASILAATIMASLYCVAGFYALLASAICALFLIYEGIKAKDMILLVGAAIVAIAIVCLPQLYYTYVPGNTVDNDHLWLKGLPELLMEKFDVYLWKPFIVASVWLLLLPIAGIWIRKVAKKGRLSSIIEWGGIIILFCGGIWTVAASKKNEQLRATVLMLQRLENEDWQGMVGIMSRIKEPPNYTMTMLSNLALSKMNLVGQDMTGRKPGKANARHTEEFTVTALLYIPFYYHTEHYNESYRWAMEHSVQYGKRVFFLKYMVLNALRRGEIPLARKYNDLLKKTMFHRKWAEKMDEYIENPTSISD